MREFVFTEATAPTLSCHASTVAVNADGGVVCAWFGGTREGAEDVEIYVARRDAGSWSAPTQVSRAPGPHWNPALYREEDGTLTLYYKRGGRIEQWYTMVTRSEDGGKTWCEPVELVSGDRGGRGPVKNKPIRLADGARLAPASLEGQTPDAEHAAWRAFADRSEDGVRWTASACFETPRAVVRGRDGTETERPVGLIQPSFWEDAPGQVHALIRSDAGRVWRADSADGGRTWSRAYATDMPNNNAGLDCVYVGGTLYLVCNPVGENWGARTPLTLFASEDGGGTWRERLTLEDEPGEYSYPAVVAAGGALHIAYTWRRERIAYRRVDLI